MPTGQELLESPAVGVDRGGGARATPRRFGAPRHLLAEGLHPAHDVVPRPLRLLHLRQGARAPRRAVPRPPTRCSRSPAAAPSSDVTRRCSPWARSPRTATRRRPSGSPPTATRRPSTTSSPPPSWCSTRPACFPTPTRGALAQADLERLRSVSPSQGMMIETLPPSGEPGGPHSGAPDKTPERRLATLEAAGRAAVPFTTGILVGIGETRAERIDALVAIADRTASRSRAGGDRPELPAQARHRRCTRAGLPTPTSCSGRSPRPACCCPTTCTSRPRPT